MRKKGLITLTLSLVMCLCSCGSAPADYSAWIPDHSVGEVIEKTKEEEKIEYREYAGEKKYTAPSALTEKLLNEDPDMVECLYESQISGGACEDLSEALAAKRTVLYVSSSEGDDKNTGLSPEKPKKTLSALSEFNQVAILLKSGDTFFVDDTFKVGAETIIGAYGEGARPVLDFTTLIDEPFVKLRGTENVWAVDLTRSAFMENRDKLNFGQLYIDGECNWNRYIIPASENIGFNYGEFLEEKAKNIWIADGKTGVLYLYSEEDPNTKEIRVAECQVGFQFVDVNNITISDVEIKGISFDAMIIMNCADVTIENCAFRNIGGCVASSTSRCGDGMSLQNTNRRITIKNNYFENIYGTGIFIPTFSVTDVNENIDISNNVFSHCYAGIRQPSDAACIVGSTGIRYDNNIFFHMSDVTNPDTVTHVDINGEPINKELVYESYHSDDYYTGIQCISIANLYTEGEISFTNNVLWSSNRVLAHINMENGFPVMSGNFFYGEVESEKVCLFELLTEDLLGTSYAATLGNPDDIEMVVLNPPAKEGEGEHVVSEEAKSYLTECFKRMLGK